MTLCVVHQHPRVLLGMKKRGFGAGRWNGFGGKVSDGETIEEAARRELREECGIDAVVMEKHGILLFDFEIDRDLSLEVHVFKVQSWRGEPRETEEMRPQWFDFMEIPFSKMWPDDLYWVPLFIKDRKFRGRFLFDRQSTADYPSKILDRHIEETSELE